MCSEAEVHSVLHGAQKCPFPSPAGVTPIALPRLHVLIILAGLVSYVLVKCPCNILCYERAIEGPRVRGSPPEKTPCKYTSPGIQS